MKDWLGLLKLRITVASTITTGVGYVMFRGLVDLPLLGVMAGILLQACGAAAINQVQDAHIDARMERTATRPIPAGRISRRAATLFALGLLAAGTAVLALYGWEAAALGFGAAVVYNLVYTPLKRVTPFAALPGALIGAIPPVVGFVAAGGHLADPVIHLVAFFFFIWQIPHFWLLLLFYARDYADGGLPSLFDRFDRRQIVKLTFIWIAALCVAALLLPLVDLFERQSLAYAVAGAGVLVVIRAVSLLRIDVSGLAAQGHAALKPFHKACRIRFMEINTFVLLVSGLLVVDALK